ncbi:prenylcysteine oxidase 1-like [Microplitis mediator]|uniref:prenylcysteine oxidase 1-like n=1 Tax=Microplitis mediator TaxID=375433 RepID=UPI002557C0DE|nr:prenylcysteine oxidase 1-like [Microplitis mediator]
MIFKNNMIINKNIIFVIINVLIFNKIIYAENCTPKIGIIGGGIGGASASHYLVNLFNENVDIDLFEADKIGGRLATLEINDHEYEAGGSVIEYNNLHMRYFAQFLKLEENSLPQNSKVGIWNGDNFIFNKSPYPFISSFKLYYKYGLELLSFYRLIDSILSDFGRIYEYQQAEIGFENLTSLLAEMNNKFPEMLKISTRDFLINKGFSSALIDELIQPTLTANFGHDADSAHSILGILSYAVSVSPLWSVKEGNKKVPENLIKINKRVKVIPAVVNKINYAPKDDGSPGYDVYYDTGKSEDTWKNYDVVIIATPLTHDQKMPIEFSNFPEEVDLKPAGEYQMSYVTFVEGELNLGYFKIQESIDVILSYDFNKTVVCSIEKLTTVQGEDSNVWRIYSRNSVEKNVIDKMFHQVQQIKEVKWKAYPKYSTIQSNNNFKLYNSLYHVNAIEWAASAMEMSAIGGRNVALLVYNDYKKKCNMTPTFNTKSQDSQRHSVEL